MKNFKILIIISFQIIFSSFNLNAMEIRTKISDENFFSEKAKGFELLETLGKYAQTHKQEIQNLEQEHKTQSNNTLFALCLLLEDDIEKGNLENLQILINTSELFIEIINTNQIKKLLYLLLNDAAYNNQDACINFIYQKYLDLFKTTIFLDQEESNSDLLKLLFQKNKLEAIQKLVAKGILDFTQDKSELKTLAHKKALTEMESILEKQIIMDETLEHNIIRRREKCCYITFAFTLGFSGLLLFSNLFL